MKGLKLVGAKIFLDMPKGTIYQRFWEDDENELLKIISDFKNNKLDVDWDSIEIYGNNNGSMSIHLNEKDYICYYDANVVGDADPLNTLYLIIGEDYIPNSFKIYNVIFTKQKLLEIKQKFLDYIDGPIDNKKDIDNEWAREYLNKCDSQFLSIDIKGE